MKKIIYTLGIIAASALAFTACQKDQVADALQENNLVTVSFTAEKAGLDTKTAAVEGTDGVSYIWTDSDINNIKLFTVGKNESGKEVLTEVSSVTATKVSDTKLAISGQVEPDSTYTFRAVLAGQWTTKSNNPRVADTQSPSATNFDPAADVLVSKDMAIEVPASEESSVATSALEMQFRRLVVVNKMTLKNIDAGEKVRKVDITSNTHLTGVFSTETGSATGENKTVTLNYSGVSVPDGGSFPVYFTSIPKTGHSLTVTVTTDNYIYTKSFAEGKTIDFTAGQFTKFNVALPAGVANTSLSLPIEDDMAWADNGSDDGNTEMEKSSITVSQGTKKIYDDANKAFKGEGGLKLGTSTKNGYIKTNGIDLSSSFYVAIDAKTYKTDNSTLEIQVDGSKIYESEALTSDFETHYVNCDAANANSTVTIKINGRRGYVKNLVIKAGTYVAEPAIKVSSDNPMSVAATAGSHSISYSIKNPTEASLTATSSDSWITDIDCSTAGTVSFKVAAQAEEATSRTGSITLKYAGAKDVVVTVKQGGVSKTNTVTYTVSSANAVTTTGTQPSGSNASFSNTYTNSKEQMTKNNSQTYTLTGYTGKTIKAVTLNMKSNSSKGAGTFSLKVGSDPIASISSATNFNKWFDNTSYGTNYRDVNVTLTNANRVVGKDESIVLKISCTTNSLYCKSITITYE